MRTLALALLIICAGTAQNISLNNGLRLRITTENSSLTPDLAPATGNSFYRIFRDFNNLAVFAYELQVERSADGKQFQITAKPALDDFAAKFPDADGGKPTPTFSEPHQSAWLSSGERFSVNIPINPGENDGNLSETIDVRLAQGGAGAPPDRTVSGLRLTGLRVSVGGTQVTARGISAAVGGRYLMFYIPGRGAYYLSGEQVNAKGFVEAGSIDGNTIRFTIDNENFEATSISPIGGNGQIWVLHDRNYKPRGSWTNSTVGSNGRDEFFTAGADSLKWWLQ